VGPRAFLEDVEERKFLTLLGLELRTLGRPARSQSLYRLRYRGSKLRKDKRKYLLSISGRDLKPGLPQCEENRQTAMPAWKRFRIPPP
jgi:hypothetical protein